MLTKEEVNKWLNLTENNKLKIHTLIDSVDALLADVMALVEAAKNLWMLERAGFYPNCSCSVCKFRKALAAVEARMK